MDAFIRHLELDNTQTLNQPFLINENLLPIPAIILLSIAGRGFIIWCLNVIFIHVILANGKKIFLKPQKSGSPLATSSFGFEQNSQNSHREMEVCRIFYFVSHVQLYHFFFYFQNHFPLTKEQHRYSDPVRHHDEFKSKYQYDNMNFQQDSYDLSRNIGRRYVEPMNTDHIDGTKNKKSTRVHVNGDSSSINSWNTTRVIPKGNFNRQRISPHKTENELSNQWREIDENGALKIERPHFRLPNKPSLLKKLSDASYSTAVVDDTEQQLQSPTITHSTDELRSQMPWSYFHGRDQALPIRISQHGVGGHDREQGM